MIWRWRGVEGRVTGKRGVEEEREEGGGGREMHILACRYSHNKQDSCLFTVHFVHVHVCCTLISSTLGNVCHLLKTSLTHSPFSPHKTPFTPLVHLVQYSLCCVCTNQSTCNGRLQSAGYTLLKIPNLWLPSRVFLILLMSVPTTLSLGLHLEQVSQYTCAS